jgi:hypothetical protein
MFVLVEKMFEMRSDTVESVYKRQLGYEKVLNTFFVSMLKIVDCEKNMTWLAVMVDIFLDISARRQSRSDWLLSM